MSMARRFVLTLPPSSPTLTDVTHPPILACFNVCTGDIEDAPAINGLHSFTTEIKDGKIHVTANENNTKKDNMSRPPAVSSITISSDDPEHVVIVGGGAGTMHAIESLRLVGGSSTCRLIEIVDVSAIAWVRWTDYGYLSREL